VLGKIDIDIEMAENYEKNVTWDQYFWYIIQNQKDWY